MFLNLANSHRVLPTDLNVHLCVSYHWYPSLKLRPPIAISMLPQVFANSIVRPCFITYDRHARMRKALGTCIATAMLHVARMEAAGLLRRPTIVPLLDIVQEPQR